MMRFAQCDRCASVLPAVSEKRCRWNQPERAPWAKSRATEDGTFQFLRTSCCSRWHLRHQQRVSPNCRKIAWLTRVPDSDSSPKCLSPPRPYTQTPQQHNQPQHSTHQHPLRPHPNPQAHQHPHVGLPCLHRRPDNNSTKSPSSTATRATQPKPEAHHNPQSHPSTPTGSPKA